MLVIPDATKDFRFYNHPSVVGYPNICFYAGAPLVSPEGYKLGTLCIVDSVPRPEGLTDEQRMALKDLADMVIKVMVDRRYQLEKKQRQEQEQAAMMRQQERCQQQQPAASPQPAQTVTEAAQEMMTPLSGLQLSLSLLKEDNRLRANLNEQQLELLNTAASCSELMMGLVRKEHGIATTSRPISISIASVLVSFVTYMYRNHCILFLFYKSCRTRRA